MLNIVQFFLNNFVALVASIHSNQTGNWQGEKVRNYTANVLGIEQ